MYPRPPASCLLALAFAGKAPPSSSPPEEEAEYAWLPPENLKLFRHGDISGTGEPPVDPALPLCIAAAERALAEDAARRAAGDGVDRQALHCSQCCPARQLTGESPLWVTRALAWSSVAPPLAFAEHKLGPLLRLPAHFSLPLLPQIPLLTLTKLTATQTEAGDPSRSWQRPWAGRSERRGVAVAAAGAAAGGDAGDAGGGADAGDSGEMQSGHLSFLSSWPACVCLTACLHAVWDNPRRPAVGLPASDRARSLPTLCLPVSQL